jgi:acyl-CoA oxidase
LQCCGGQGFLSENKIAEICNDMNVDVTFEGDNTVMMQQVGE